MAGSVPDLLRERARDHPERLFLWCAEDRLTFGEADARTDRVAAGLAEAGVAEGDRVAVISTNRIEFLELFFGCAKLGAVLVPLNVFLKGEFLRYQLDDSQASTLVVDGPGLESIGSVIDELPAAKRIVSFDDGGAARGVDVVPYARVRASDAPVPAPDLFPEALFTIMYTSGTTGMPKGCMLGHGWYLHSPRVSSHMMKYTPEDVLFTTLPLFHAWAQGMVMGALTYGLTSVVDPLFSATSLPERWAETGATTFAGVGMMGAALLAAPPTEADRAHRLRAALMIPFTAEQQAEFKQRFGTTVLAQLYGQTECGAICYSPIDEESRNVGSLGRPSPAYDVGLVDDHDDRVPAGEVGEIVVRPRVPHAMYQGYWRKPEATVEAWRNLWHHTGDLGRADSDGYITFVDRKKDAMRRRGENVSSVEVERAIAAHPKIAEAAVHAVPSPMTEDDIKACLVLASGESVTPAELFGFFRERLPYFAIPRYVEIVPELPRNATLRVMKHLLRARGVTPETWDFDALGLVVGSQDRR